MADLPANRRQTYEVTFWCRSDLCFCNLGHYAEVDEHEFHKLRRFYDEQGHHVVARFVDIYNTENLPDWDFNNCELINDDQTSD